MARIGRLPDVFIVGAPRCGTGSMYMHLGMHPQVHAPAEKEPHYFARDIAAPGFVTSRDAYVSLYGSAGDALRVVDGSVWYLYSQVAPRLIREAAPDAKAIVMLRDPIELMRSLHARNHAFGDEEIADFAAALEAEPDRAVGRRMPRVGSFPEALMYSRAARLGEQASRLLQSFPRSSVHFVLLDELATDSLGEYQKVLDFIGVERWLPATFERFNPNRRRRSGLVARLLYQERWSARALSRKVMSARLRLAIRSSAAWRGVARANAPVAQREPLDANLRDRLRDMLRPDVELLGGIVGRDLAALWWAADAG